MNYKPSDRRSLKNLKQIKIQKPSPKQITNKLHKNGDTILKAEKSHHIKEKQK